MEGSRVRTVVTILCLALGAGALYAEGVPGEHPKRVATAVRANPKPPKIDGVLNERAWDSAPVTSGFTQVNPDEGDPATEKTEVRIVYDDEAIYFGIQCFDSEPDLIVSRLARRDESVEADYVSVDLDPHHDHQTGFTFAIGPSSWIRDGILHNDGSRDYTWDGVWEGRAALNEKGWSAELRIPYYALRFTEKPVYTWGIQMTRRISRRQEGVRWVFKTRREAGWVSKFGHLEGISGIRPPRHLEVVPYAVGRATFLPSSQADPSGRDLYASMGMDLRYGISPGLSVNGTFNPDFGQVEADPAVLNLGVFETFFEERRPFFMEGISIFRIPDPGLAGFDIPAQLFHSRRIGRRPARFPVPAGSDLVAIPGGTTILGAMKLSGKTEGKTSIGIIEAVTAKEHATIEVSNPGAGEASRRSFLVEPLTNYLVGRVQQSFHKDSNVGALVTAVNGKGFDPAYVASADAELKWKQNAYRIYTRFSGSRTTRNSERRKGYEALAYFSKWSGSFGGQAYVDARSPGFDSNDLGFMDRNNRMQVGGHVYATRHDPWLLARESGVNVKAWRQWNYEDVVLRKGIGFDTWHDLKNYWWWELECHREFRAMDDLVTRGGPPMVRPASIVYGARFGTDTRKPVVVGFALEGSRDDGGTSHEEQISGPVQVRPASNIQLEITPRFRSMQNFSQWIRNVDEDGDGHYDHYVFGELEGRVFDLTVRTSVSFTPRTTLQLYLQSFVTTGDYGRIKRLAQPESYTFEPYAGLADNPDFSRRSMDMNLVFRWEFRPGSTLFVVWSQAREESLTSGDPSFAPWSGVRSSFTDEGRNIFLVKVNRWLGL